MKMSFVKSKKYLQIILILSLILFANCVLPVNVSAQKTVDKKLTPREIAQQTLPSTVLLVMGNSDTEEVKSGSGFFVAEDVVITNFHVIKETTEGYAKIYGQEKIYEILGIVGTDEKNDLALLKIKGIKGKALKLNADDSAAIGDEVFAVGNPKGLEGTFSQGIVSSIRKTGKFNLLQITASISSGSSGGAILNNKGQVVGVAVGAIESGQALNFAIPVSLLRSLLLNQKLLKPLTSYGVVAGTIRKNLIGMELVFIPSGEFMMGSDEKSPYNYATPLHKVIIKNGFWMGKYEVTQGQWQSLMGTTIRNQRDKEAQATWSIYDEGANYPMYYVSWAEAQEFIKRLNAKSDGFVYSLPSEAEWEYVARAGTTKDYHDNLDEIAWYANNSGRNTLNADYIYKNDRDNYEKRIRENGGHTYQVGKKKANSFGLQDMFGNVSEWCEDFFTDSYEGLPADGSANVSKTFLGSSEYRMTRGGSWLDSPTEIRPSTRGGYCVDCRNNYIGFRVLARIKK